MAKRKYKGRRRRTFSEKLWIAIAILISVSMVLTTVAALFSSSGQAVGF